MTSPMPPPIRVLAVIDNRILREGIRCLIETEPRLELEVAVFTLEDALLHTARLRPDLILMDLDLPANRSLDAIRQIRTIDPAAWIIALITNETPESTREALSAGASDVLPKHLLGKDEWQTALDRIRKEKPLKTGGSNNASMGILKADTFALN